MATITIKSNKTDDIYFLNEMARRMNLETIIEAPENETGIGRFTNDLKKEDKRLAEMAFHTTGAALEKFFETETEKMF